jgi:2-oxoglutarate dehydrogenase E1 component
MMQQYQSNSYLFGGNAPYVEELYEAYLQNPSSVPDNWRAYFDAMQNVPAADGSNARDIPTHRSSPRSPSAPSRAPSRPLLPRPIPIWAASASLPRS